jgi:hypothetical protein
MEQKQRVASEALHAASVLLAEVERREFLADPDVQRIDSVLQTLISAQSELKNAAANVPGGRRDYWIRYGHSNVVVVVLLLLLVVVGWPYMCVVVCVSLCV